MGWAHGTNAEGREVGYGVEAECDKSGCATRIDRGLDYVCGDMHDGGEYGCGQYFCGEHLFWTSLDGTSHSLCARCTEKAPEEDP